LKKAEVEGLELHQQKEREYLYNLEKIRREVREAKILRKAEEEKKKHLKEKKEKKDRKHEEKLNHQQIVIKITHHVNKIKKLYAKKQSIKGEVPETLKERIKRRKRKIHQYVANLKGSLHNDMKSFTNSALKELRENYSKHKNQKKKATVVAKHPEKEHTSKITIRNKLSTVRNKLKIQILDYKQLMNSKAEAKSDKDRKKINFMLQKKHKKIIAAVKKMKKMKKIDHYCRLGSKISNRIILFKKLHESHFNKEGAKFNVKKLENALNKLNAHSGKLIGHLHEKKSKEAEKSKKVEKHHKKEEDSVQEEASREEEKEESHEHEKHDQHKEEKAHHNEHTKEQHEHKEEKAHHHDHNKEHHGHKEEKKHHHEHTKKHHGHKEEKKHHHEHTKEHNEKKHHHEHTKEQHEHKEEKAHHHEHTKEQHEYKEEKKVEQTSDPAHMIVQQTKKQIKKNLLLAFLLKR